MVGCIIALDQCIAWGGRRFVALFNNEESGNDNDIHQSLRSVITFAYVSVHETS